MHDFAKWTVKTFAEIIETSVEMSFLGKLQRNKCYSKNDAKRLNTCFKLNVSEAQSGKRLKSSDACLRLEVFIC